MKLSELITRVKTEKPNAFSNDALVAYVNQIEAEVAEQMDATFTPYDYAADAEEDLLAPPPYDRLYISYLKGQIDMANDELDSYENYAAQHTADFRDFTDWTVRYFGGKVNRFVNAF